MAKWKYQIDGTEIRQLINEGDSFKVLEALEKNLKAFIPKIKKDEEYMVSQFEELYDLVEGEVQDGEDALIDFIEEEDYVSDLMELVDDRLDEFYNLCDGFNVWITL